MLLVSLILAAPAWANEPVDSIKFEHTLRWGAPRDAPEMPDETGITNYRALLFAAEDYDHPVVTDLTTPFSDVAVVGEILEATYGFEVSIVRDPTRAVVIAELERLVQRSSPNDAVLLYWAGRGSLEPVDRGFWWPIEADPHDTKTWIDQTMVWSLLRSLKAAHLWIVSDAPFSRRGTQPAGPSSLDSYEAVLAATARKSRLLLTSGNDRPVPVRPGAHTSVLASALQTVLLEAKQRYVDPEFVFEDVRRYLKAAGHSPHLDRSTSAYDDGGSLVMINQASCDHDTAEEIAARNDTVRESWRAAVGPHDANRHPSAELSRAERREFKSTRQARNDAHSAAVREWMEAHREPVAVQHCGRPVQVRLGGDLMVEAKERLRTLVWEPPPVSPGIPMLRIGAGAALAGGAVVVATESWRTTHTDAFTVRPNGIVVETDEDSRRFRTYRTLNWAGVGLLAAGAMTLSSGFLIEVTAQGGAQVSWHGRW